MTPLRKQLSAARDAHRGATYPGDLAADLRLLGGDARARFGRGVAILAGTGIAALAAAAAIALFVMPRTPANAPRRLSASVTPTTTPANEQINTVTTEQVAQSGARTGTASMFSPPSLSSLVPTATSESTGTMLSMTTISTDMPSFPSLSALQEQAGSISNEQLQRERQLDGSSDTTTTTATNTTSSL